MSSQPEPGSSSAGQPAPDGAIRVLCVDDDQDFLDLVAVFLGERQAGLTVETATSGAAVLDRLAEGGVDCVVSDYRMPRMDGLALLTAVRETYPDLPFILFTGRGGEDIAAEAVSAGVTDYIRKSTDPDQFGLLANRIRNVVERHRARVQYQTIFDSVSEAILVIDADSGTVTDANRRATDLWGYAAAEFVGLAVDDLRVDEPPTDDDPERDPTAARGRTGIDGDIGVEGAGRDRPDGAPDATGDTAPAARSDRAGVPRDTVWHCLTKAGRRFWGAVSQRDAEIDGRTQRLVIVRDVTRRTVRQQQLDGLLATVRDLLVEGSERAIADAVVRAAVDTLRFDDAALYLLDDDGRAFRPAAERSSDVDATTEEADWLWMALDEGELVHRTDTGRLYFPLGAVGVLRCTRGPRTDSHDIDLVALLATFAAGAVDRAQREALLRDREETVRAHRDELLALNHVNEVIRDINQALVSVSSREGIERLVCEKFVATDRYSFAWVGTYESGEQAVVPTTRAGRGDGFPPERVALDGTETSAMRRAIADREVTVIDRLTPDTVGPERYQLVRERGFRSVAYVPVVHQHVLYRLVAIYADEPNSFGDREREVLRELGETIGLAMAAAEWRSARIAESAVQLELAVEGDGGLFSLTADGSTRVAVTDLQETGSGRLRVFARVSGTTFEAFERAIADAPTLAEPGLLGGDDPLRVVFTVQSGPLLTAITRAGIAIHHGAIADGGGTFRLTVPSGTDVRWIVEQFEAAFDAVELVSRQDRFRPPDSTGGGAAIDSLTDRQQEALRVAFHAGYFDRPRQATGQAVAELLGVSQPTFNEHLRNAEHRVFDRLLGAGGSAGGPEGS